MHYSVIIYVITNIAVVPGEDINLKALSSRWDMWDVEIAGLTRRPPGQHGIITTMELSIFAGKCVWEEGLKIMARPRSLVSRA